MPLDQSFSAENFRKILDLENRKGAFLEGRFFPEIVPAFKKISTLIKICNQEIRLKKKHYDANRDRIVSLRSRVKKLKEIKEKKLMGKLKAVSDNVIDRRFKVTLKQVAIPSSKPIYTTENTPENYFAMKQLQSNLRRLFKVKQSNRYAIVSQVMTTLENKFPKYVIRTDIDDFYESIPHEKLLDIVHENNLLTPLSKKIIRQVLEQYKIITGNDVGIPRGIGISAYLSERYMRDIDNSILALEGVTYYARYVDDMIIVFTPAANDTTKAWKDNVEKIINEMSLSMNAAKTATYDLISSTPCKKLDYLGYKIFFGSGSITTRLSTNKVKKYKLRIDTAIEAYNNFSKVDEKKARKLLVKRIRFLTCNTRLINNKRNILIGVFYSNSQLTYLGDLIGLDRYLAHKITTKITPVSLQKRLEKYKFEEGFITRRFTPFKPKDLSEIMKVWKQW
jgi:hypothetical protein